MVEKKIQNDVTAPAGAGGKHLQKQMMFINYLFNATNHNNILVKLLIFQFSAFWLPVTHITVLQ